MEKVYKWAEIEMDFKHGLVLGNGASIAFDSRFAYRSLKDQAKRLRFISENVQLIFEHLQTDDFERVLRMLWHANKINEALGLADDRNRITQAYQSVRDGLIEIIRKIHVTHGEVRDRLEPAAKFMSRFKTVVSLSYDVLVYWAILVGNDSAPNRFKDCFIDGDFKLNWNSLRTPCKPNHEVTLVFYPHGNLALAADLEGREAKISTNGGADLLETIFEKWTSGSVTPVFVSEGTSAQKMVAIRRSPYLSKVYEEVLPALGESVVMFGWSIGENDDHLLDAIRHGPVRRYAVAVNPAVKNIDEIQSTVRKKLLRRFRSNSFELKFFDRGSDRCWIAL